MKKLLITVFSLIIALAMALPCLAEGDHAVTESDFSGTWKPDISTVDIDTNSTVASPGELVTLFSEMTIQIEPGMVKIIGNGSTPETYPAVFEDGTLSLNTFTDEFEMWCTYNDDGTLHYTWKMIRDDFYATVDMTLRRDGDEDVTVQEESQEEQQAEAQEDTREAPQEVQQEELQPQEDQGQQSESEDTSTDAVESGTLTYEEIKDIVFDTMVDGERVFKFPSDNDYFYVKGKQFPCRGAMLMTIPGISDGKLAISSLLFVFDKDKDPDKNNNFAGLTLWDIESIQQENVLDLIGESLNEYIDFANGGKLVFCMTQDMEGESQILFEYSPVIDRYSDRDIYKTQNYDEFDSFEAFRDKTYGVLYGANHNGESAPEEKQGGNDTDAALQFETLQKGSKGNEVVKLQNRLNELGYSVGAADGDFGNKTKTAIENFQKDHGMTVTGIVDEDTYNAIFSEDESGTEQREDERAGGFSELVSFKGKMMDSVASQLNSATDLTETANNRAILAALLSLEFVTQQPDFTIDYSLPIYACKQGDIASVAVGGEKDYAVIIFQMHPLSTSYGYLYGNDPATVRAALESTNESVWQVSVDAYNEKLAALVDQL